MKIPAVSFFENIMRSYYGLVTGAFFFLLLGTLSFGRGFSVLSFFDIGGIPFYVTDLFLIMALPASLAGLLSLRSQPALLRRSFYVFLAMGSAYLFWGILVERNPFAFRGVVLSFYVLFLPLVFRLVDSSLKLQMIFLAILGADVVSILVGRYIILQGNLAGIPLLNVWGNVPTFNLGLYYAIALAFLFAYGLGCANRLVRWLIWFFVAINSYMVIIVSVRAAWFAMAALAIFYILIFRPRIFGRLGEIVLVFVIVVPLLYAVDFGVGETRTESLCEKKMEGLKTFLKEQLPLQAVENVSVVTAKPVVPEQAGFAYDNIIWRFKVWERTWELAVRSPIWGHGFGSIPSYDPVLGGNGVKDFRKDSGIIPPHNHVLTVFYKMGFIGVFLFFMINGLIFQAGLKAFYRMQEGGARYFLAGILGAIVAWHTTAFFFDVIDSPPTNILLWILLGLVLVVLQIENVLTKER